AASPTSVPGERVVSPALTRGRSGPGMGGTSTPLRRTSRPSVSRKERPSSTAATWAAAKGSRRQAEEGGRGVFWVWARPGDVQRLKTSAATALAAFAGERRCRNEETPMVGIENEPPGLRLHNQFSRNGA